LGCAHDRQSRTEYGIDRIHPVFVQRSTVMSTHPQTLNSHGELLANLPGILGFYPNDSLILAFFVDDEGIDTLRLGPVARFDLDEAVDKLTESRERFAAWINHLELDAVIAYVISDDVMQPI